MNPSHVPFVVSHTQLLVMLLSVVTGMIAMMGFVLWAAKHAYEERRRLRCPASRRMATVRFRIAPDGTRTDVLRCSLLKNETPRAGCRKACLAMAAT